MIFHFLFAISKYGLYFLTIILLVIITLTYTSSYPSSFWLLFSAIIFSFLSLGKRLLSNITFIFLLGTLAAILSILTGWIGANLYVGIFYIVIVTYMCTSLGQYFPSLFYASMALNLIIILSGLQALPLTENVERGLFIFLGVVIVIVSHLSAWLSYIFIKMNFFIISVLTSLSLLSEEIFSCLLESTYEQNTYLFERRLHVQKEKYLINKHQLQKRVEKIKHPKESQRYQRLIFKMDDMFDNLMDIATIRLSVTDHATFELCQIELQAIGQELVELFKQLISCVNDRKKILDINLLTNKITSFDENYQHVLNVSAKDPIVFLLFLTSLKSLTEKIADFAGLLTEEVR